jgi:hypothetical protein
VFGLGTGLNPDPTSIFHPNPNPNPNQALRRAEGDVDSAAALLLAG